MRLVPESDVGVAMAAGALLWVTFVVALGIVAFATPTDVTPGQVAGFALGFAIFAGIYFGSMRADAVLTGDRYEPGDGGDEREP